MTPCVAIGIDFGGTNVKVALVSDGGQITAKASGPTDAKAPPESVIAEMADLAKSLVKSAGASADQIVGAGLGSPGPLDFRRGTVVHSVNLPTWENVPIREMLAGRLGMDVALDNDANAAAFGEYWAGAGKGGGDFVLLTLGTGLGAGVVVDGNLLHGYHDNAAELGHMIVVPDGLPCGCGQQGCVEQYASASAVARRVKHAIESGASSVLSDCVDGGEAIDSRHVAQAASDGDPLSLRIWDEACTFLAIACVNIQHTFNPESIVLGGGMSEAGEFLLERVQREFLRRTWRLESDRPQIRLATLGYDAGVIGAAGLAWKRSGK